MTEQLPAGESLPEAATRHFKRRRPRQQIKPRSDSILSKLNDEQHRKLCEWLLSNKLRLDDIRKLLLDEFGVQISIVSISKFYRRYVADYLIAQRRISLETAYRQSQDIKKNPANFETAMIDALKQKTLLAANDRDATPKDLKHLFDMVRDCRRQTVEETKLNLRLRQLALMEKREKEARATMQDSRLTAEQQAEKLREIFKK